MQDAGTALLRHPAMDYLMLWVGMAVGGLYSTWSGDELHIVTGAEIALMALLRFAMRDRMRWFFIGLGTVAAMLPLLAISTGPLFYLGGLRLDVALELAGVAALPALGLGAFAAWGARHAKPPSPEPPPAWVGTVERAMGLAVLLMAVSLGSGQWGLATVTATILGAVGAFVGLLALLWLRLSLSPRGVGAVLVAVGGFVMGGAALLVATQGGRVSPGEAALAAVPGALLALVGLAALLLAPRPSG
ncbi:MAG: hypothetical protein H6741_18510 [Alphaproteobacteria bacterium]|nr:hypothetical protein [Alphaproteobacteria bacterium]MCB9794709.1 hypothetical protein [Alphaproteobacteria bacterium]